MPRSKYATAEERREAKLKSQREYRARKKARLSRPRRTLQEKANAALGPYFGKLPPGVTQMIANRVRGANLGFGDYRNEDAVFGKPGYAKMQIALRGTFTNDQTKRAERLVQTSVLSRGLDEKKYTEVLWKKGAIFDTFVKKLASEKPDIVRLMRFLKDNFDTFAWMLESSYGTDETGVDRGVVAQDASNDMLKRIDALIRASRPTAGTRDAAFVKVMKDVLMSVTNLGYHYSTLGANAHKQDRELVLRFVRTLAHKVPEHAQTIYVHAILSILRTSLDLPESYDSLFKPFSHATLKNSKELSANTRDSLRRSVLALIKAYAADTTNISVNSQTQTVMQRLRGSTNGNAFLREVLRKILWFNDAELTQWYVGTSGISLPSEPRSWFKYATSRRLHRSALGLLKAGHRVQNTGGARFFYNPYDYYQRNYNTDENIDNDVNDTTSFLRSTYGRNTSAATRAAITAELRRHGVNIDRRLAKHASNLYGL
jgi:hypothetical protein